jgi:hypothetical protein
MASKLTTIAREKSAAQMQLMSRESYLWFMKKLQGMKNFSSIPRTIANERDRHVNSFKLGQLYFFYYDPKTKEDMPYYDKFPLVLILEKYQDGFLGLNLHYLPLEYRLAFMDKLMDYASYTPENEIKRIRVTYDILSASKRFKEFRPCIKRYLFTHIKSKILTVQPQEWETAVFLPIHQFKKAKDTEVWSDSLQEIRKP